jgi:hypothetical protein
LRQWELAERVWIVKSGVREPNIDQRERKREERERKKREEKREGRREKGEGICRKMTPSPPSAIIFAAMGVS